MIRAFANGIWFTAAPATCECEGCVFDGERTSVCREAEKAARASDLPDCESRPDLKRAGFIYLRDESEGRQHDLLLAAKV